MTQAVLLERELDSAKAARVIDLLRRKGMYWTEAYTLLKLTNPDSGDLELAVKREVANKAEVILKDLMNRGEYSGLIGRIEQISCEDDHVFCKVYLELKGVPSHTLLNLGFKSAQAKRGTDLPAFAELRDQSFEPGRAKEERVYHLIVKDVTNHPQVAFLGQEHLAAARAYQLDLVKELKPI